MRYLIVPTEFHLPHNHEAERAVIGAILLENDVFDIVESIIGGDEFFDSVNETIYHAMRKLRNEGDPIDLVTLTSKLQAENKLQDIGGITFLSALASAVPSAAHAAHYAKEVRKCSLQRMALETISKLLAIAAAGAEPENMAAMMDQAAAMMLDQTATGNDFRDMRDVMLEAYENLEKRALSKSEDGITGVASGFPELDKMTSGFQRSDLIIVAARPSVGKTAFALNIAQNVGVRHKKNVAIFSLEMSTRQLAERFMSSSSHIDGSRIRTGRLEFDDWDKLAVSISQISETNIFIDDTPASSVSNIRAKCRRLKKRLGEVDLIIIDYLQLITLQGRNKENRQQEVSEISRVLKQIARELDVPVIALSQLSRAVEQRQDKRPMLSDLRESGSIEQDADIVAFLYRDDYYDKESEKQNIIEIIIAKHRNGPVGTVELAFMKNFNKFTNLDQGNIEHRQQGSTKPIPDMYRVR